MLKHCLLLLLVADCLCHFIPRDPTVISPAGRFRGKNQRSPNRRPYSSFRGIPYAKPPVGDLRFAKPQPLPKIQGLFDATDFGPICIQWAKAADRGQEDCLTLNVFTPFQPLRSRSRRYGRQQKLKQVMVYVHGGGFLLGSSKDFVPGQLVSRGDVVVVTVNYRLGWLGILRGNTDELPGNQGIWDVLLALKWTKDNIKAFGGNPDDITLGGHSSGSALSALLSISPLSSDLFNKVFFLSGGTSNLPASPRTSNDLLAIADTTFGCNVSSSGQPGEPLDVDAVTRCLKDLPALAFDTPLSIQPLVFSSEDEILPRTPAELSADPDYLQSVGFYSRDYLRSVTKEDGYISVNSDIVRADISTPEQTELFYSGLTGAPPVLFQQLFQPYRDLFMGDEERAVTAFFTDSTIQGVSFFLNLVTNVSQGFSRGDAYLMSFDYEPSYIQNKFALHGIDLVYLFDLSPQGLLDLYYSTLQVEGPFTIADTFLEVSFVDLITDFIKTGNPGVTLSKRFHVDWTPYDPESKSYLSFSNRPELDQDLLGRRFAD